MKQFSNRLNLEGGKATVLTSSNSSPDSLQGQGMFHTNAKGIIRAYSCRYCIFFMSTGHCFGNLCLVGFCQILVNYVRD